jgi:putative two-component system response regulator
MTHEQAVQLIIEGRGKHFDPDITDAFLALQEDFIAIAAKFWDSDSDLAKKAEYLKNAK